MTNPSQQFLDKASAAMECPFTAAFFEALLWADVNGPDNLPEGMEPRDWEDIHADNLMRLIQQCETFKRDFADLWKDAKPGKRLAPPDSQAGHDFYLTRQGHGAGFWDRPDVYGQANATRLTKAAKSFAELTVSVDPDGTVYAE